ncbi:MAG TPA: amidohydrolase family protein [Steroidobacteraceae bacterium]|nr:amidohydrolase family protein [Steroidobacteraceae bacterium]
MNRSILCFALAGANLCLLPCRGADAAQALLIENVTVLSPQQAQPRGNQYVLVRDGRIAAVSDRAIAAPDARKLDGSGKFLTPGIMDGHVHVSDAVGLPFGSTDPAIAEMERQFLVQQPRSYLYFGVTQVVDLINRPARVAEFTAQPQHPDTYRCGLATVVDGYPLVFWDPATRYAQFDDYIYEPANAREHPLPAGADPAAHTPEAVVERIAKTDAICVKITLEDGFGDRSDWPLMSLETLRRVRAATRQHGLLLLVHANALDMQRRAVEGQVDIIAHGLWNWNELQNQPGIPPAIADHLRNIRGQKIGYIATLRVLPGVIDLLDPTLLDDPAYPKVVPPAILKWYHTDAAQWFKTEVFGPKPDAAGILEGRRAADARWATSENGMRALRHLFELGQPLLLGSDTPSAPTYGNQPGYDTFREMQMMARAGIPLSAIFAAATINNARAYRMEKDYGTVEKGKIANLLLLDANPLADVDAWSRIEQVILRGEPIDRESLAAN